MRAVLEEVAPGAVSAGVEACGASLIVWLLRPGQHWRCGVLWACIVLWELARECLATRALPKRISFGAQARSQVCAGFAGARQELKVGGCSFPQFCPSSGGAFRPNGSGKSPGFPARLMKYLYKSKN